MPGSDRSTLTSDEVVSALRLRGFGTWVKFKQLEAHRHGGLVEVEREGALVFIRPKTSTSPRLRISSGRGYQDIDPGAILEIEGEPVR